MKLTKLSFTRWSVHQNSATLLYEQATIAFKFSKENTKEKEVFEKVTIGQERLSSSWNIAKHLESARSLAKELHN